MDNFGSVLIVLGVIFLLAFMIETLVEFAFAPLFNHVPALKPYKDAQRYVAIAVAVLGAFIYGFDLLYLVALFLANLTGAPATIGPTPYGIAITGVAIGHGAAYLHDLVMNYFKKPKLPAPMTANNGH